MSLYYTANTNVEGQEEVLKECFAGAREFLEEESKKLQEGVFNKTAESIEKWLEERLDNGVSKTFDHVTNALLAHRTSQWVDPSVREEVNNLLLGIGYSPKSFRKKLFEENKEEILKDFQANAIYISLQDAFSRYSFKDYSIESMKRAYPQTEILQGFARYMLDQKDFSKYLDSYFDNEIINKKKQLDELSKRIEEAKQILGNEE